MRNSTAYSHQQVTQAGTQHTSSHLTDEFDLSNPFFRSSGIGSVDGRVEPSAAAAAHSGLPGSAGSMYATSSTYYDAFSTQDQSGTNYVVSVSPAGTPAPSAENTAATVQYRNTGAEAPVGYTYNSM